MLASVLSSRSERSDACLSKRAKRRLPLEASEAMLASRRARAKQISRVPSVLSSLEASEAMLASRRSARHAAQPHARKFVDLADLGTIRSRSNE